MGYWPGRLNYAIGDLKFRYRMMDTLLRDGAEEHYANGTSSISFGMEVTLKKDILSWTLGIDFIMKLTSSIIS